MNVLPIVTEFRGFIRCIIAGPSSNAVSLRGLVGGPGVPLPPKVVVCLPLCHGTFVPCETVMVG